MGVDTKKIISKTCFQCKNEMISNPKEWDDHGYWDQLPLYCRECHLFSDGSLFIKFTSGGFAINFVGEII